MPYLAGMSIAPSRRRNGCARCGQPVAAAHAPFCSRGCKDRDLLNWLGDSYRVPGDPAELEEGLDSERQAPV